MALSKEYTTPARSAAGPAKKPWKLPLGVLPQHYSELVVAQNRQRSTALAQFLDLIHHRAISLFYRAWVKYRPAMAFERSQGRDDPFSAVAAALTGLLRLPVRVESFIGGWLAIDGDSRTRLPSFRQPEGQFCRLGVDAAAGARAWDAQGRFRLKIGPLDYPGFLDLMPGGAVMGLLTDLVRLYVGPEFDAEAEVSLAADAVPLLILNPPEAKECGGPRLGWNTWLLAGPAVRDRADAVFQLGGLDEPALEEG